ncbi:hypothetical protein T06_15764 [Trichinella sp. T6]|nr:hypothetical protein T06_15764 [Trichinella sp. T6]
MIVFSFAIVHTCSQWLSLFCSSKKNNNITNQTINVLSAAVANEIKYSPARSQFSRHLAFSSSLFSLSARLFSRASYNSSVNLT